MKLKNAMLAVAVAYILMGCGGGGQSSTPVSTTNFIISGTAATGNAIAGASVNAKCVLGIGAATTIADGTYNLAVTGGQLPCVIEVIDPIDNSKLHSIATGSSNTIVANITPLTEMLTARALGKDPVAFFAAFDASFAVNALTTTAIKSAQSSVNTILSGTVDTTSISDFIMTPLKAATADNNTGGDAQDKLLDALRKKINSTQLTQVVAALARTGSITDIKQVVDNLTETPPIANAGVLQSVIVGATITLDGSASAGGAGRTLSYVWTLLSKPIGSTATLSTPTSIKPTFIADSAGTYVATVIVNDGKINSSVAAVTITVALGNVAPVANAGTAQTVMTGAVVALSGISSSDANGDSLTYAWTLTAKPAGSSALLSSATSAQPTFTADAAGVYVASLIVNDSKLNSSAATITVTATVANIARFAYVANGGSGANTVSAYSINATTGILTGLGAVATGTDPVSVVTDHAGKFVYVVNYIDQTVSGYIIAANGTLTSVGAAVPTGRVPRRIIVDPTDKFAYVVNYLDNTVSAYTINVTTGVLTNNGAAIATGVSPSAITVVPSGKFAYVSNTGDNTISAYTINLTTGALTSMGPAIAAVINLSSITVDPTGKFVFIAGNNNVSDKGGIATYAINATNGVLTSVGGVVVAGTYPVSVAVDPSGRFAYVANLGMSGLSDHTVSAFTINATTGVLTRVGANVATGLDPLAVTADPSGRFVYVVNASDNTVSAYTINAITGALTNFGTTFGTGKFPDSIITTK